MLPSVMVWFHKHLSSGNMGISCHHHWPMLPEAVPAPALLQVFPRAAWGMDRTQNNLFAWVSFHPNVFPALAYADTNRAGVNKRLEHTEDSQSLLRPNVGECSEWETWRSARPRAKSRTSVGAMPSANTAWMEYGLKASLWRSTWGC